MSTFLKFKFISSTSVCILAAMFLSSAVAPSAFAGTSGSEGHGQVTVRASTPGSSTTRTGSRSSSNATQPDSSNRSSAEQTGSSDSSGATQTGSPAGNPDRNWSAECNASLDLQAPHYSASPYFGAWYQTACQAYNATADFMQWLGDLPTIGSGTISPLAEAETAEASMTLPSPSIETNPSGSSFVNLATWLWVAPDVWHPWTETAVAGLVAATATAVPVRVEFSMGDGGQEVCDGPGNPYDPNEPSATQGSDCSYTYGASSAGLESGNGNPNDAAYVITATIIWEVTWASDGDPGGGVLPALTTTSSTPLRVEQIESVEKL